jgi:hypothetical protein
MCYEKKMLKPSQKKTSTNGPTIWGVPTPDEAAHPVRIIRMQVGSPTPDEPAHPVEVKKVGSLSKSYLPP